MRHKKNVRKLGRTAEHRDAMIRNMVCSLFEHGRITTTVPKAKEARRLAERCITFAKKGTAAYAAVADQIPALREAVDALRARLEASTDDKESFDLRCQIDRAGKKIAALNAPGEHCRRQVLSRLHQKGVVKHLFEEIAPRYQDRAGGYTRILKAGFRLGDKAPIALFELV